MFNKKKVKIEMSCLGRLWTKAAEKEKAIGEKKISLVINNVRVSEVKPIMQFIHDLRAKRKESV